MNGASDPVTSMPSGLLKLVTSVLRTTTFRPGMRLLASTRRENRIRIAPDSGIGSAGVPVAPPRAVIASTVGCTKLGLRMGTTRKTWLTGGNEPPTIAGSDAGSSPNGDAGTPPNRSPLPAGTCSAYSCDPASPGLTGSPRGFIEGTNGSNTIVSGLSRWRPTT